MATDSGKTANQVAEIIISELLKNKVIEDTPRKLGRFRFRCNKRGRNRGTNRQLLCGNFRGVGRISETGIFHCPGFGFNG